MTILATIISLLLNALYILILARIIFSFIQVSPYHPTWGPIFRFVYETTEPLLAPIRNLLPPMGGLDFSPLIVLILARLLGQLILSFL
jgi:YggT family protein